MDRISSLQRSDNRIKLSYSKVDCFKQCRYRYYLRYFEKLKIIPEYAATDPLILGSALHKGIECTAETMLEQYYKSYPILNDYHFLEALKLEHWIRKLEEKIPIGGEHEVKLETDNFVGYIDYIVPVNPPEPDKYQWFDLYDWKYSNNIDKYTDSAQLHIYKYYFEKLNPTKKIRFLNYVFIPKCNLRLRKSETLTELRKRINDYLQQQEITTAIVGYDERKVIDFLESSLAVIQTQTFEKSESKLCDWCEYKKYCLDGDDIDMMLPSTERRQINVSSNKKIWMYGLPFTGKTYLANQFEKPLMLNTDGNYKQVDAPVVRIADEVSTEGRIVKRKYAWEVFKDVVDELEKGSDFKTIIVDLLEDVYDACRVKVCSDHNWEHESDDGFKAYDIVRNEFLRTLKRLINLDYNIVLISHEDTSRDITKRSGDKVTAIRPNINEKVALKIAGMVDIVCRIVNNDGCRRICFKSNEIEFGGGRLAVPNKDIDCTYAAIAEVYGETKNVVVSEVSEVTTETDTNEENNLPERKVRKRR